jgi:hypothetical protein
LCALAVSFKRQLYLNVLGEFPNIFAIECQAQVGSRAKAAVNQALLVRRVHQ